MTGFILIDKPPGPTSHDMVDVVRRAVKIRRVGHAGTLDPPASGLVVVAVGPATRLLRYVQDLPKTYETRARLGITTTTLDADGEVLDTRPVDTDEAAIHEAAAAFVGEIDQIPPAVSAIKVGGERSYRRAARGEDVTLKARRVRIHELEVVGVHHEGFELRVVCSAGTYVRSLVADIGERLGCGAHVTALRRTAIGPLTVDEAVAPSEAGPDVLLTVEQGLRHLSLVTLDPDAASRAANGRQVEADAPDGLVLVRGPDGPVGVFEGREGIVRPVTVLGRQA